MFPNSEINALYKLLDDPDKEVASVVESRFLQFGEEIIPQLEHFWLDTESFKVQERIENIIQNIQFEKFSKDLITWAVTKGKLISGVVIISSYFEKQLDSSLLLMQIEKLRQSLWLEMNKYLTLIEQGKVISRVLYGHNKFKLDENASNNTNSYLLHQVLKSHSGSRLTLTILYTLLAEKLEISSVPVKVNNTYFMAWIKPLWMDDVLDNNVNPEFKPYYFFTDAAFGNNLTADELQLMNSTELDTWIFPKIELLTPISIVAELLMHIAASMTKIEKNFQKISIQKLAIRLMST